MKQLLIAVMVSVVCSLIAVSWFTESKSTDSKKISNSPKRNTQHLINNKKISKVKLQHQQKNSSNKRVKHTELIAGFSPSEIDKSLTQMTKKLALSDDQQSEIRHILLEHFEKERTLKKSYIQAKKSLTNLDVLSKDYPKHKVRLMNNVQTKLKAVLLYSLKTKENIYVNLNPTQQQIISNM